jgi:hypothetical protein
VRSVRGFCFEYQSNGNSRSRDEGAIRPTSKSFVVGWTVLVSRTWSILHYSRYYILPGELESVSVCLTAGLLGST